MPNGACMLVVTVRAEKLLGTICKMFLIVIILTQLSVLIRRQKKKCTKIHLQYQEFTHTYLQKEQDSKGLYLNAVLEHVFFCLTQEMMIVSAITRL